MQKISLTANLKYLVLKNKYVCDAINLKLFIAKISILEKNLEQKYPFPFLTKNCNVANF